jgi:nucleoside phosphorylase
MAIEWRETLKILLTQFEARAGRSSGLNHLFVEVSSEEPNKISGPSWFTANPSHVKIVGGRPQYRKWEASTSGGLPWISPGFRPAAPSEELVGDFSDGVIRDQSGVAHAVAIPIKTRRGFYCGQPSEDALAFESLADAAATALAASKNLHEHFFASDLTDIFRKPRGGVRYVFGEVPETPRHFTARGWDAGISFYEHGVVIDLPLAESAPDASHWVLLLHRLGWRQVEGSGLRAARTFWNENIEVTFDPRSKESSNCPKEWAKQYGDISQESYYSILGTKESPLDVNLASVFAIQLLLSDLTSDVSLKSTKPGPTVDYSNEEWNKLDIPQLRTVKRDEVGDASCPQLGILVATDVEREAVLKRMRPPKNKRAILQVFEERNTYFLGRLGTINIVLCMTAMGSSGRDSSTLVTSEVIQSWKLPAVIMVGIAFGKDPVKQEIGNVIVSERIISYEPQRVGENSSENRGSEYTARPVLLNRFRNVLKWSFKGPDGRECGIQTGPILSGEKLVDNADFKRQLFERYPTAIGGEMEGTGVAASAERLQCEWIVVKAICDWGDGTKTKQHQGFAAASSVALVEHVLNQFGVLDSLPQRTVTPS